MQKSNSFFMNPIDTGVIITCKPIGNKILTNSLELIILNKLLSFKYVSKNNIFTIHYFNDKYTFKIIKIKNSSNSIQIKDNLNKNKLKQLKIFKVTPKSQIKISLLDNENDLQIKSDENNFLKFPNSIGGLENQLDYLKNQIQLCLYDWKQFKKYKLKLPRGILLFGPPGTGKTLMVKVLCNQLNCSLFIINGPEIMGKIHGESESKIRSIFDQAKKQQPSIIFIDEIDAICPKRESLESEFEKRIISQLISCLDQLHDNFYNIQHHDDDKNKNENQFCNESSVVVLAATNRPDSLDSSLRRPGRFDREIEIGIPNPEQRFEIINLYMNKINHSLTNDDLHYFSSSTHGYVGADLSALCREACIKSLLKTNPILNDENHFISTSSEEQQIVQRKEEILVTFDDMKFAMSKIRPSAMRELMIEVPHVSWDDIGGNDEIKQNLKEAVEWPLRYPEAFERMGIRFVFLL